MTCSRYVKPYGRLQEIFVIFYTTVQWLEQWPCSEKVLYSVTAQAFLCAVYMFSSCLRELSLDTLVHWPRSLKEDPELPLTAL